MHIGLHQIAQRLIHQTVALDGVQTAKSRRYDGQREMPAVSGAGMAGVRGRFVGKLHALGIELLTQTAFDHCGASTHGNTLRNGFTVTL